MSVVLGCDPAADEGHELDAGSKGKTPGAGGSGGTAGSGGTGGSGGEAGSGAGGGAGTGLPDGGTNGPLQVGRFVNQGSGLCLGVPGGTLRALEQLVQSTCNGAPDQKWAMDMTNPITAEGRTYHRYIDQNSNMCLGVESGSVAAGARVVQSPCQSSSNQYWAQMDVSNGYAELVNRGSALCLGVVSGSRLVGAKIVQWNCLQPPNQLWQFRAP